MNLLIWQIVIAVGTLLVVAVHYQTCCRRQRGQERRVVPVRLEQRPVVPYASRLSERRRVVATRTIAVATLPMPINGTIDVEPVSIEAAQGPLLPPDLRFPQPDAALMQRVIDGLRALPSKPKHEAR